MKRLICCMSVLLVLVLTASMAAAQTTRTREKDHESNTRYVLVEKSGDEVTCNMYTTMNEVRDRLATINDTNKGSQKANRTVAPELKKLQTDLAAKERKLKAAAEADKEALQKEVDDLKAQLAEKEAELKSIIKYVPYKHFSNPESAQKYIDEVNASAARAKEAAEKKKAKDAATDD